MSQYRPVVTDPPLVDPLPVLGAPLRWTKAEVAELSGVDEASAARLWLALGFPEPADDTRAFTDRDVAALRAAFLLQQLGATTLEESIASARAMGRTLASLANGQIDLVVARVGISGALLSSEDFLDPLEQLVVYVWRRHLLAAIERIAAHPEAADAPTAVGFVDLVGYTARSRDLDDEALTALLAHFDATVHSIVVAGEARIIKTIGDEVMWATDSPAQAAEVALTLSEQLRDPPVRVGVAYGSTVHSGGDLFGPVVNVAARLRGLAKPGTVLIDKGLATALARNPQYSLRQLRAVSVRGYDHLQASVLRRPAR